MGRAWAAFLLSTGLLLYCVSRCEIQAAGRGTGAIEAFCVDRAQTDWRILAELSALIDDENADQALRAQARAKKMDMLSRMEQEAALECLFARMGYGECAVSVGQTGVYIFLPDFDPQDAPRALEAAVRETGRPPSAVRILPIP